VSGKGDLGVNLEAVPRREGPGELCLAERIRAQGQRVISHTVLVTLTALLVCIPNSDVARAQGQLVREENILDGILERRDFEPIELNALDVNRDGVLDVADLTFHLLRNAHLVPSVAFEKYTSRVCEGDAALTIPLVFSKDFEAPVTITYTLTGTAAHGPSSAGGDFTITGYDGATGEGAIAVEAGESTAFLELTIHDDGLLDENMETVTLTLSGGDAQTYYLGGLQTHVIYLDDNDGVWRAGLELPDGPGYVAFDIEMAQENGVFTGRVLADNGVIPTPEEDDPNRDGDDGWQADVVGSSDAIRIEIGPIPVASSLSVFDMHYSRYFVLEAKPGQINYVFDAQQMFSGQATQVLEPVRGRLGPVWEERSYLRREATGTFAMARHPSDVMAEEVTLSDAE